MKYIRGKIIDGTGREPIPDGIVAIQGDRIAAVGPAAVGPASDFHDPPIDGWIDAGEGTVLPGVIDSHAHTIADPGVRRHYLQKGVTSVCDLGSPLESMVALRGSEQDSGLPIARGFQSGSIFTAPGGLPGALFQAGLNCEVQTPEEARVGVLDLVFQGADVIKIYLDPWAGRDFPVLQPEVAAAIVKEAHAQGLVVRAHVNKISMLETALDAGVDVLEHVPLPHPTEAEFREFLEHRDNDAFRSFSFNQMETLARLFPRLVAQGIIMVPTLSKLETSMRGSLIPEVVQPQVFQSALDTVGRFYELGGIVVLGTDHNANWGKPVEMPIREMELLLEAGLTRMDVICGATRHAAYVCGQGDELGTLENGKLADLVILEGDPLVDIHAFSKVRSVVLGGELI